MNTRLGMGWAATRSHGVTHVEWIAIFALISVAGLLGWPLVLHAGESGRKTTCANNLKHLALALNLYSNENFDRFPPLDQRPGNLMFDGDLLYPEYINDVRILGCPSDPRYDPTRSFRLARTTRAQPGFMVGDPHPACIDSTSYMYLGRLLMSDADLQEYRQLYGDLKQSASVTTIESLHALPAPDPARFLPDAPRMRVDEATRGTLLLRTDVAGLYVPAPSLEMDVDLAVSGLIARGNVRQRFSNPTDAWVEGVYVFPLPENAAVDRLRLWVGDRVIEGEIQERGQARQTYELAKAQGQRAGLVEQERPNIFTTSVANIPPHDEIRVEIEYQQSLRYDAGIYRLRFPMTVGVRYIPGAAASGPKAAGTGWAPDTDQVPDASRITPPVLPKGAPPINPVRLTVDLDAGVPLARVESSYHDVHVDNRPDGTCIVRLAEGTVPADRDFELVWEPVRGAAPLTALFAERHSDATYALAMVMPPQAQLGERQTLPRNVTLVLDRSGSMAGHSISQARAALKLAVGTLQPRDTFNIVTFSSAAEAFFSRPMPAVHRHLDAAMARIDGIRAEGGTEMMAALQLALGMPAQPGYLHQVIFITDGQVGNEDALFGLMQQHLGARRLFTVGIGSAPNSHFMTKAAEVGHGTFTYVASASEVQEKMNGLFLKLEHPVLTDIRIAGVGGRNVELMPTHIPDLYIGEPVVLVARFTSPPNSLVLLGRTGKAEWRTEVPLGREADRPGVAALFGRRRIDGLLDGWLAPPSGQTSRDAATAAALEYHLVSPYTSLVAVDRTPVRTEGERLETRPVPTNLPYGWEDQGGQPNRPLLHLSSGVERFLMTDLNCVQVGASVGGTGVGPGDVPVMWERPAIGQLDFAHTPAGQHVMYLDGHVEFAPARATGDHFPTSPYSRAWTANQRPAPAGVPGQEWENCTDLVSVAGEVGIRQRAAPFSAPRLSRAWMLLAVVFGLWVLLRRQRRPAPSPEAGAPS